LVEKIPGSKNVLNKLSVLSTQIVTTSPEIAFAEKRGKLSDKEIIELIKYINKKYGRYLKQLAKEYNKWSDEIRIESSPFKDRIVLQIAAYYHEPFIRIQSGKPIKQNYYKVSTISYGPKFEKRFIKKLVEHITNFQRYVKWELEALEAANKVEKEMKKFEKFFTEISPYRRTKKVLDGSIDNYSISIRGRTKFDKIVFSLNVDELNSDDLHTILLYLSMPENVKKQLAKTFEAVL